MPVDIYYSPGKLLKESEWYLGVFKYILYLYNTPCCSDVKRFTVLFLRSSFDIRLILPGQVFSGASSSG